MRRNRRDAGAEPRHPRRRWVAAALLSIFLVSVAATPALSDEYDRMKAGHPLRIAAYILHPIGVAIDYLILRPAHWLVSHEPIQTLFGHED
ncbi:MAG: hypothetical protein JRJ58_17235 [Deltaproteobacteria bacterium]|nr:hypothetical protein [Deltaproteobacteria bacterium]